MSGRNQRRLEKELFWYRLECDCPYLHRSTDRIATDGAASATADSRANPFLHWFPCNPDTIRLRGVGLEGLFIDGSRFERGLNTQWAESFFESIKSALYGLMRRIAAIAGLP